MRRKTKIIQFSVALLLISWVTQLSAAPENEAEPSIGSIDVNLEVLSDYIWRGHNLFNNYNIQKKRAEGATTGAWTFHPILTWNTAVDGLYLEIDAYVAVVGRGDKDIDQRIQTSAGGDFVGPGVSIIDPDYIADPLSGIQAEMPAPGSAISAYGAMPGFYKEPVGLNRVDEVDYTIGYEKETRVGTIGFGISHYSYANLKGKADPFACEVSGTEAYCGEGYFGTEIFATYALPFLPELTLEMYSDLVTAQQYYSLTYADERELSEWLAISYSVGAGQYVFPGIQGISDVTSSLNLHFDSVGFDSGRLTIGLNAAYRPNRQIQAFDFGDGAPLTKLPVGINGENSAYSGRSTDYSQTLGPINEYVNSQISNMISAEIGMPYTYNPTKKIESVVYWVNFGYSFSIE